jgi:hypothetical protein
MPSIHQFITTIFLQLRGVAGLLPRLALLGVLSAAVRAADFTYSTANNEITITGYTGTSWVVNVPATIGGLPVTRIGDNAFQNNANITNVSVPAGVVSIGNSAFYFCSNLTYVTLPASVTSIGNYAFGYCYYLAGIVIPPNVTSIGYDAFFYCERLPSVSIPASVVSIDTEAFGACYNMTVIAVDSQNANFSSSGGVLFDKLKTTLIQFPAGWTGNYTVPAGVTYIGSSAFLFCDGLLNVTLPAGLLSIEDSAFDGCYNLLGVTLPASVTNIGNYAFFSCDKLQGISIPAGVASIGRGAFGSCDSMVAITVNGQNANYVSQSGVLFDKQMTTLIQCPGGKSYAYTIPAGVTSIGDSAFMNCTRLTSVTMPASITSIGSSAFDFCTSLMSAVLPVNVKSIGSYAFYYCTSLTSVTIPASVTSIGGYAFSSCAYLFSASFLGDAPSMGASVFDYAAGGFTVNFFNGKQGFTSPSWQGYTSIMKPGTPNLGVTTSADVTATTATLGGSVTNDGGVAISARGVVYAPTATNSKPVIGGVGVTKVAATGTTGNFTVNASGLMPNTLYSFAAYATNGVGTAYSSVDSFATISFSCSIAKGAITVTRYAGAAGTLDIPALINGLPVVGVASYAFQNCNGLTAVTFPDSVTTIGTGAFSNCRSLSRVTLPVGVTSIGNSAFFGCGSLTSVTIPASVTSIGSYAFASCGSLTSIKVNGQNSNFSSWSGVLFDKAQSTLIQYPAGKTGSFNIPGTVTSIGSHAFSYAGGLAGVTLPAGVTRIGVSAFYRCSGLTTVTIPASAANIGNYAFHSCASLARADFLGNAPSLGTGVFASTASGFTLYYLAGASGFTSPTWNGYPANSR